MYKLIYKILQGSVANVIINSTTSIVNQKNRKASTLVKQRAMFCQSLVFFFKLLN